VSFQVWYGFQVADRTQAEPGDRADAGWDAQQLLHELLPVERHPDARGHGLGGRLVDTCVDFARAAGYARLRLWTNDPLVAARRVYLQRGFLLTEEQPHHSFGVDLIGQTYQLDLRHPRDGTPTPEPDPDPDPDDRPVAS
jgi:GNAT superfamily N-acetyltransferase